MIFFNLTCVGILSACMFAQQMHVWGTQSPESAIGSPELSFRWLLASMCARNWTYVCEWAISVWNHWSISVAHKCLFSVNPACGGYFLLNSNKSYILWDSDVTAKYYLCWYCLLLFFHRLFCYSFAMDFNVMPIWTEPSSLHCRLLRSPKQFSILLGWGTVFHKPGRSIVLDMALKVA